LEGAGRAPPLSVEKSSTPEKKYQNSEPIELEDSKTDYKFLRQNLLISSLRILHENKDAEYPQRLFEINDN